MSGTTSAYLRDAEQALLRAKGSAHSAAAELVGGHQARVLELIDQIDVLITSAARIEMYTRADELSGNPHSFAAGVR